MLETGTGQQVAQLLDPYMIYYSQAPAGILRYMNTVLDNITYFSNMNANILLCTPCPVNSLFP
jgi:hypothetical protein